MFLFTKEIEQNIQYDTACIGIDTSRQHNDMSKWGFDPCLNRHQFICKKEGTLILQYVLLFTCTNNIL